MPAVVRDDSDQSDVCYEKFNTCANDNVIKFNALNKVMDKYNKIINNKCCKYRRFL